MKDLYMLQPRAIDVFSHQGYKTKDELNHYNEDRFVASGDLFAVIDGATSVTPHDMDGLNTSAYTSEFIRTLFEAMAGEEEMTATDILLETNTAFGEHLKEDFPEVAKEGKLGPCASVVVVKMTEEGTLSFAQVGDCILLIKRNGQWHQLTPDVCYKVDIQTIQKTLKKMPKGFSNKEIVEHSEMLKATSKDRELINVKIPAFNGEPAMKKFVMDGEKSLEGIEAMALMCDGMAWPGVDEKEMYVIAAKKMEELGVKGYWNAMKAEFDTDIDFEKYLRFKHMDDATAMVVYL